jgi:hypothetical protein
VSINGENKIWNVTRVDMFTEKIQAYGNEENARAITEIRISNKNQISGGNA